MKKVKTKNVVYILSISKFKVYILCNFGFVDIVTFTMFFGTTFKRPGKMGNKFQRIYF